MEEYALVFSSSRLTMFQLFVQMIGIRWSKSSIAI